MNLPAQWRRDPEIADLIRHFDEDRRYRKWDLITNKEFGIILKELERIRSDFSYAARNYFMLSTKEGEDVPFALWESQELILEKWYWLREHDPDHAQRIMILKARQLGCSTVIEGLIAWATIFFSNRNAMVVSNTDSHAAYLFGMMQHFYDNLPWWLQPMVLSRKFEQGLIFANSNYSESRFHPGNKSQILVQSAKQTSGVGQGIRLNAVHLSEYADWEWDKFKEIINGDMIHALADNRNSFAFLESTGKGAGSPGEEMWVAQVQLMERGEAKWVPLFIPWFFEKKRFIPPENGWCIQQPEQDMLERVEREWVRCGNCNQYYESTWRKDSRVGSNCLECHQGILTPYKLTDSQLRFMQRERTNAELEGIDSLKKLREELATTAEEAWQLSGIQVFPDSCHVFVNNTIGPPIIWGDINDRGEVHYVADPDTGKCGVVTCEVDHRWDMEHPLQIWKLPDIRFKYSVGVDVSEGLGGKGDFSVIFVNKIGSSVQEPDEQVAVWRSNNVDPIQLAGPINAIGRLYNEALVSIEVNKYDACFNNVRLQYLYPNLFNWKHYDSKNPISNKLGWVTNLRSKPMLWQTAVRWLKSRMWMIRSQNFSLEMKRFQKDDYDDQRASAEKNFHDDELMAGMIALFCAHDLDFSEDLSFIPIRSQNDRLQTDSFTSTCERCQNVWVAENPRMSCPRCNCMIVQSHRNTDDNVTKPFDFKELSNFNPEDVEKEPTSLREKMGLW